jgi:PAS domain S-box-containing protein
MALSRETPLHNTTSYDGHFYREVLNSAAFSIVVCSADMRVIAYNTAAERLLGAASERRPILGACLSDYFTGENRPRFESAFKRCLTGKVHSEMELSSGGTGPRGIDYTIRIAPLPNGQGEMDRVSVWFCDISERVRYERRLGKRERLGVLSKLSGAVAHHYSNLLCSIGTSLEFAMNMNTMSAMRRALQRTSQALSQGSQMTHNLLAFAQADHHSSDQCDLIEGFLTYFDENDERLAKRDIRVDVDWEMVPYCVALREPLRAIIGNIVDNAIDAMPNGGTLTAALHRYDERLICLSISDTGTGISPGDMDRLFEPFHTTKGALVCGTGHNRGLGLAVAHGLVNELGGTISASNMPGGGARFDVLLPIVHQD